MSKYHYVYKSFEEEGREYIGRRTCDCLPEEDTKYFGSFTDKTFFPTEKTILFVCETRKEAAEIEIELHDFFDVAVNPQFANQAKATSTKFDTTGVPCTEECKKKISEALSGENSPMFGVPKSEEWKKAISGEKHPQYGVPRTEAQKKAISKKMSGEKNPMFGVPHTEEWKKANSERNSGEKHPRSKAIIAVKPDGTELHFGSGLEAARVLGMSRGKLFKYLQDGHVLTQGPRKGWQFRYGKPVEGLQGFPHFTPTLELLY